MPSKKPAKSADSIQKFLAREIVDAGYKACFAEAICQCGGRAFTFDVDEAIGEACWYCQACGAVYCFHSVETDEPYEGSPEYDAVDCQCSCGESRFQIVVAVTLYGESDTARTAYLGGRCVKCGRIACYASWPRVDMPYPRFFANMKNRLRG